jgi:SAM-dependent methyltransferase
METPLFLELLDIYVRPPAFSRTTVASLWTDPRTSEQMLGFHLDGSVAISSQTTKFIDAATAWMAQAFGLTDGSRVLDLGCGPGLYANRLARTGADVTGIDFSARSIAHARDAAAREGVRVDYINEDYLVWLPDRRFDLALMIMRDYCALAPEQRLALLDKFERLLEPGGALLFDVDSMVRLASRTESVSYTPALGGGFWSADPYFEFHNSYTYPEDGVALDKFVVVEAERTRTFYNWIQCFSPESLGAELGRAGLEIDTILGDLTGRPFDPQSTEFAVIAHRRSS